jgi:hypothetical protein
MTASAQWWPLTLTREAQLITEELADYTKTPRFSTQFPVAMRIRGAVDVGALEMALNTVIRRHRGLTAAYHPTDAYNDRDRRMMLSLFARRRIFVPGLFGQWMYPDVRVRIQHRTVGPIEQGQLARVAEEESSAALHTDMPPVMRATVISFDSTNHLLVLTVSHMVVDGWSAGILRDEVIALYTSHITGQPCPLPEVTSHAGEFAVDEHRHFRSEDCRRHAEYWQRQWKDAADSVIRHHELPCALRESPPYGGSIQAVRRLVGATESQLVRQLAHKHRITPYVFFRTVFALLLHRYTGRRRIAFWANFANRRDPKFEWMIASCVHPHILPMDVSRDSTVLELCRDVALRLAEAQRHEAVSEAALPLLGVPCITSGNTRITFDAWPASRKRRTDSVIEPVVVAGGRQWVDVDVRVRDEGDAFALYVSYNDRRYSATGIVAMLHDLVQFTSSLIATLEHPVSKVTCPLLVA